MPPTCHNLPPPPARYHACPALATACLPAAPSPHLVSHPATLPPTPANHLLPACRLPCHHRLAACLRYLPFTFCLPPARLYRPACLLPACAPVHTLPGCLSAMPAMQPPPATCPSYALPAAICHHLRCRGVALSTVRAAMLTPVLRMSLRYACAYDLPAEHLSP